MWFQSLMALTSSRSSMAWNGCLQSHFVNMFRVLDPCRNRQCVVGHWFPPHTLNHMDAVKCRARLIQPVCLLWADSVYVCFWILPRCVYFCKFRCHSNLSRAQASHWSWTRMGSGALCPEAFLRTMSWKQRMLKNPKWPSVTLVPCWTLWWRWASGLLNVMVKVSLWFAERYGEGEPLVCWTLWWRWASGLLNVMVKVSLWFAECYGEGEPLVSFRFTSIFCHAHVSLKMCFDDEALNARSSLSKTSCFTGWVHKRPVRRAGWPCQPEVWAQKWELDIFWSGWTVPCNDIARCERRREKSEETLRRF